MGKSGHIARKIASTLASTGTPAYFVHPAEASHGDLGMVSAGDVFIAISYSGESDELLQIVPLVKRRGAKLIAHHRQARIGARARGRRAPRRRASRRKPARSTSRPPRAPPRRSRSATRSRWRCSTRAASRATISRAPIRAARCRARRCAARGATSCARGEDVARVQSGATRRCRRCRDDARAHGHDRGASTQPARCAASSPTATCAARSRRAPTSSGARVGDVMTAGPRTIRAGRARGRSGADHGDAQGQPAAGGRRARRAGRRAQHARPVPRQGDLKAGVRQESAQGAARAPDDLRRRRRAHRRHALLRRRAARS